MTHLTESRFLKSLAWLVGTFIFPVLFVPAGRFLSSAVLIGMKLPILGDMVHMTPRESSPGLLSNKFGLRSCFYSPLFSRNRSVDHTTSSMPPMFSVLNLCTQRTSNLYATASTHEGAIATALAIVSIIWSFFVPENFSHKSRHLHFNPQYAFAFALTHFESR